ncbi:MAG: RNA polymerase sigma factor [Lachnospiraceae bacterium]|nr:RNA polymerase sigma factor [Lachnospiraceae bacterium]
MKDNIRTYVERQLLDNYQKYYRLAYSYVKNEADALDIVQESAYKAMKNCGGLKEEAFADTWIYRIVVNTALDFLRSSQRQAESVEEYLEEEQSVEEGYEKADIMATLSTLATKDRSVLILRYFESFKLEQIAEMTGESLSTVKSRLYRAQEKLRLKLE